MDPLSNVLSLLKLRSYVTGAFNFGGDWSIAFGPHEGIKFYAVVSGECWLIVEGVPDAVRVGTGDCFLLPRGRPFRVASDLALTPVDALTFFPTVRDGGIITYNGGGDFFSVGGYFALSGTDAGVLLGVLPPIVHIRKESDKTVLRWSLERMRKELREPQPGGFLIAQQLVTMMLVQALRLYLAEGLRGGVGWLFALADRQMAAAINAMHEDPAHRWTVQTLAERAAMSRTAFSLRFKETVGASPMEYLTRWRMLLAGDRLANSSDSISAIALSLGYESDSAFSTAFKRVMGCSPRHYSGGRTRASPSHGHGAGVAAAMLNDSAEG
jgi:AraC-like DNA-binding protein